MKVSSVQVQYVILEAVPPQEAASSLATYREPSPWFKSERLGAEVLVERLSVQRNSNGWTVIPHIVEQALRTKGWSLPGRDPIFHEDDAEMLPTEEEILPPALAPDEFIVEAVKARRWNNGNLEYLIKWENWDKMTWEPAEELSQNSLVKGDMALCDVIQDKKRKGNIKRSSKRHAILQ